MEAAACARAFTTLRKTIMIKPDKKKTVQVTSLKSIGVGAPEFHLPVSIKKLNGDEVTIGFTAKALRKTEWAAMRDELFKDVKVQDVDSDESEPVKNPSFSDAVQGGMSKSADLVMKFAIGWDLEDQFTNLSLVEMEDQLGGSLAKTLEAYDAAIFHGRLGN